MKQYRNRGRPMKKPNKTEFEMMYYEFKIPTEELAKRYEVTKNTIYNWAYQFRKLDN